MSLTSVTLRDLMYPTDDSNESIDRINAELWRAQSAIITTWTDEQAEAATAEAKVLADEMVAANARWLAVVATNPNDPGWGQAFIETARESKLASIKVRLYPLTVEDLAS